MDVVIYDADRTRSIRSTSITHELAQIMCAHRRCLLDDEVARLIFPSWVSFWCGDILNRADYGDEQELEAEIMASVIPRRMNTRLERKLIGLVRSRRDRTTVVFCLYVCLSALSYLVLLRRSMHATTGGPGCRTVPGWCSGQMCSA